MLQKEQLWIVFAIIVQCSAAKPSPLRTITKWPSLITSRPKCPSVPSYDHLKPSLQVLTSRPQPIYYAQLLEIVKKENRRTKCEDAQLLEIVKKENRTKCEDNVVELHAEGVDSSEIESPVTNVDENIDKSDRKDISPSIEEGDTIQNDTITTIKEGNTIENDNITSIQEENTIQNDKITTIVDQDTTPNAKSGTDDLIEPLANYIPIFRPRINYNVKQKVTALPNNLLTCCETENFNTKVENAEENLCGDLNTINDRKPNKDVVVHFITNSNTKPILKVERTDGNYNPTVGNINTIVEDKKGTRNMVIQFINNGNKNSITKLDKCSKDTPINTLSVNLIPNYLTLNAIPTQATPIGNPNSLPKQNTECLESDMKCPKATEDKEANLVFFKPETITLRNVEGEFLKEVTMTVLVPVYKSKLNVQGANTSML